jgi:hypothetical protein
MYQILEQAEFFRTSWSWAIGLKSTWSTPNLAKHQGGALALGNSGLLNSSSWPCYSKLVNCSFRKILLSPTTVLSKGIRLNLVPRDLFSHDFGRFTGKGRRGEARGPGRRSRGRAGAENYQPVEGGRWKPGNPPGCPRLFLYVSESVLENQLPK